MKNKKIVLSIISVVIALVVMLFGNNLVGKFLFNSTGELNPTSTPDVRVPNKIKEKNDYLNEENFFYFSPKENLFDGNKYLRPYTPRKKISLKNEQINAGIGLPDQYFINSIKDFGLCVTNDSRIVSRYKFNAQLKYFKHYKGKLDPRLFTFLKNEFLPGDYILHYGVNLKSDTTKYFITSTKFIVE
ncbi:MAG: hypothetical protein AAFZ15_21475 [Bacteroidota bacterium]